MFINFNKVYRVRNKDLGIKRLGSHYVVITWLNKKEKLCRVKTITSLEHKNKYGKCIYDYVALSQAKHGIITPYSIKELNSDHWSGIHNSSKVISTNSLEKSDKKFRKPKNMIKKDLH